MEIWNLRGEPATGAWKTKWKVHHRNHCQPTLPSQNTVCTPATVSRGWMLRLRLWGLDPRERTLVTCHEYTLRRPVWHSWGSPGESLGLPERQEIIAAVTLHTCKLQDPIFKSGIGKIPWCWERVKAEEGGDRAWDGWMASLFHWTWIWENSGRRWGIEKPGELHAVHGAAKSQTGLGN